MSENKFESLAIDGWELVKFEGEEEPRVPATEIGRRLGYQDARMVKKLIERSREELSKYGEICWRSTVERQPVGPNGGGTREYTISEPYLNEGQALVICARSDTPKAADVRFEVISVYLKVKRAAQVIGVTPMQLAEALEPLVLKLKENGIALDRLAATNSDTCLRVMRLEAAQVGPGIINKHQREHIKTTIDKIASMRAIVEQNSHQSSRMRVENELRNAVNFPRTIGGAWRYLPLNRLGDTNSMLARMEKEAEKRLRYYRIANNNQRQPELF